MNLADLHFSHLNDTWVIRVDTINTRANKNRTVTFGILCAITASHCHEDAQRATIRACSLRRLAQMHTTIQGCKDTAKKNYMARTLSYLTQTHRGVRPDARVTLQINMHPYLTKHRMRKATRHVLEGMRILPKDDIDWLIKRSRVHVKPGRSASEVLSNVTHVANEYKAGKPRA